MKKKTNKRDRVKKLAPKIFFICIFFTLSLVGLNSRVAYLKISKGAEYETKVKDQQINRYDVVVPPNRGAIVDRNNQALAISTAVFNVVLDSAILFEQKSEEQEKTLTALAETFPELEYEKLKHYITLNPETNRPYLDNHWKYLVKGIDRPLKEKIEAMNLIGVVFEQDTKRAYPLKTLACHVLGFIRGDSMHGLERLYNQYMVGTPGRSFITYGGGTSATQQDYPAKDGNTIVTTLDYTIQKYAEDIVAKTATEWPSEAVAAMVMNPNTGEIYAMADSHMFDLNDPGTPLGLADEEFKTRWEALDSKAQLEYLDKMWANFNISSTYEPGSIFKPMVVAAALEDNIISTGYTAYCAGKTTVVDTDIGCWYSNGHGEETIEDVLKNSCNMGMIDIANKMGKDRFYKYQRDFGIGEKTGIDLPAEAGDSPSLYYTPERIGPVELATMSFGQSFNCTSIQVLSAFGAVINGGNLMKPYVVSQIVDEDNNVVYENKPEVTRKVISRQTSDLVRGYMKATIESGTGKKAKIPGYSIGGKTGTSEQGSRKREDLWTLSMISYFPVENPQYMVMTLIHRPDHYVDGLQSPVPMTKELIENIIRYKNIEPTVDEDTQGARKSSAKKVMVQDFSGQSIYDVVMALDVQGLNYKVIGVGNTISNQMPHGGTEVDEGSEVMLYVEKAEGEEEFVPAPNVVGLSFSEAVTTLNDAGFTVSYDETKAGGIVIDQKPKYGVSVEYGSEVSITLGEPEKKEENNDTSNPTQPNTSTRIITSTMPLPEIKEEENPDTLNT